MLTLLLYAFFVVKQLINAITHYSLLHCHCELPLWATLCQLVYYEHGRCIWCCLH